MAEPLKRYSTAVRMVLAVLMDSPLDERYGLEIADEAGLKAGSLYPVLARLEEHGWLKSRWEDVDPSEEGRPRRRYYQLTDEGIDLARQTMASSPPSFLRWLPGGAQ